MFFLHTCPFLSLLAASPLRKKEIDIIDRGIVNQNKLWPFFSSHNILLRQYHAVEMWRSDTFSYESVFQGRTNIIYLHLLEVESSMRYVSFSCCFFSYAVHFQRSVDTYFSWILLYINRKRKNSGRRSKTTGCYLSLFLFCYFKITNCQNCRSHIIIHSLSCLYSFFYFSPSICVHFISKIICTYIISLGKESDILDT